MKPTIQQVVAHFGLPEQALESEEIGIAIENVLDENWSVYEPMMVVAMAFDDEWDCPITDWFKPNDGKDE